MITGLAGLRPRSDEVLEVKPLAPPSWDWWCLERVPYHGKLLSIVYDRTGQKFGKGRGLRTALV